MQIPGPVPMQINTGACLANFVTAHDTYAGTYFLFLQ